MIALSFDDGYKDFYENALPIITKYDVPVHHNICPGLVDKKSLPWTQILNIYLQNNSGCEIILPDDSNFRITKRIKENTFLQLCSLLYKVNTNELNAWINEIEKKIEMEKLNILMNWDMIRECSDSGVHIGSHSLTHQNLLHLTDKEKLNIEINTSKSRIFEEVGIIPQIFAFPNGWYNEQSMRMVMECGFKIILLCDDLVAKYNETYDKDKAYIFPRINISQPYWQEEYLRCLGFHQSIKKILRRQ